MYIMPRTLLALAFIALAPHAYAQTEQPSKKYTLRSLAKRFPDDLTAQAEQEMNTEEEQYQETARDAAPLAAMTAQEQNLTEVDADNAKNDASMEEMIAPPVEYAEAEEEQDMPGCDLEETQASLAARIIAASMATIYGAAQQLIANAMINITFPAGDPSDVVAYAARQQLKNSMETAAAFISIKTSGKTQDTQLFSFLRQYEVKLLAKYTTAHVECLRKTHKFGHQVGVALANLLSIWLRRHHVFEMITG